MLLFLAAPACSRQAPSNTVILITMESVRGDQTSAAHYGWATTDSTPPEYGGKPPSQIPEQLDEIATAGVRFTNAFAPSGSAFASLVGLHTGRSPDEAGVYADFDKLVGVPTLAESLSASGVRCGAFITRPGLSAPCGLERGFATYFVGAREEQVVREARVWFESMRLAAPERPLFLWVHFSAPRPPFESMFQFARVFAPGIDAQLGGVESLASFAAEPSLRTPERRRALYALHAACVLQSADAAHTLLTAMRPLLDDFRRTLIIFAGTNGEELGDRGPFGSRRTLRDATLHVPMFLWTRALPGTPHVAAPVVELYDIAPTVADVFAVDPPEGARGRNLFHVLNDPNARKHVAYATWESRIFTARSISERIICNPTKMTPGGWPAGPLEVQSEELYDEFLDSEERANLAGVSSEALERMRANLTQLRASVTPRPPVRETDAARLEALRLERTHEHDDHPSGPLPTATCGGRP